MQKQKPRIIDDRHRVKTIMRLSILGIVAFLVLYIYTYWFAPFPGIWNDLLTNLYGILAVGLCTSVALAIWRRFHRSEPTHVIWLNFALGLFAWFLADTIWGIYNMTIVELPRVSWADLSYILGYCFFFVALHRQFKILFQPDIRWDILLSAGFGVVMVLLTYLAAIAFTSFTPGHLDMADFLNAFYPVGDLGIALTALVLVVNFGHGAFGRPWLGLVIFTIADSLYAWLYESGSYAYSVIAGNLLSLTADTLYTAAYLVMAFLLLQQFFLVKYGPTILSTRKEIVKSNR